MDNEQISTTTHWADPDGFSLLLDKARQFAGEYIDGLELFAHHGGQAEQAW